MNIYVREGQFFADGFAVRRSFRLEEGERRLVSYITKEGCGVSFVSLIEGEVRIEGGSLRAIVRREGTELRPLTYRLSECATLTLESAGRNYTVECRSDLAAIKVSGGAEVSFRAKYPFSLPSIRTLEGQREALVAIDARCAVGEYLAIIALSENRTRLLLEEVGEIRCRGNEVTVKRRLNDLCGRTITNKYLWRGESFELSREITRARAHSFRAEEMGIALLEGVIAGDDESIRELLSAGIDPLTIYDYFGEVVSVEKPFAPSPMSAVEVTLLKEGRYLALTYDFDFDERGLIENIRCLDEE